MGNREYQLAAMQDRPAYLEGYKNYQGQRQQEMRDLFKEDMREQDLARDLAEGPQQPWMDQFKGYLDKLAGNTGEGLPGSKQEAELRGLQGTLGIGGAAVSVTDPADAVMSEAFRRKAEEAGAGEFGQGAAEIFGGLVSGIPGAADAARVGTKGAGMFFGGIPKKFLKEASEAGIDTAGRGGMREAQLTAMQGIKGGFEVGSPVRKGVVTDAARGAILSGDVPGGSPTALGQYRPRAGPGLTAAAKEKHIEDSAKLYQELTERAGQYRDASQAFKRIGNEARYKELGDIADRAETTAVDLQKWADKQVERQARRSSGPLIAAKGKGRTPSQQASTAFHETGGHSAQRGGGEAVTESASELAWSPYSGELERVGHDPAWSRDPMEQQARYLQSRAEGKALFQPGTSLSSMGEMVGPGGTIISRKEAAAMNRALGIRPELHGILKR